MAEEVQRAQNRTLSELVRDMEALGGFGGRAAILAESQTYASRPDAYLDRVERLAQSTAADVRKSAKEWLAAHHYTLHVNPMPQLAAGKTDVDRKILPSLGSAPEVSFPAVQRATLSNGLKVLLLERHSTPIVNFALAADAGYASDPGPKAGLAALTLDVIDEGTTTRDAFRLVDELDAIGARIGAFNTEQLNAAGRKYVRPDEVIRVIVGDLEKIEAGVRELGLGEVVRYGGEM